MLKFASIIDELIINDYSEKYSLCKSNKEIYIYIKKSKFCYQQMYITINRRYSKEILVTCEGSALNNQKNNNINTFYICPFFDMVIFPDGWLKYLRNDYKKISNFKNTTKYTVWNLE